MMIKAIIFDFDGVVMDTGKYHYQSWEILLNRIGLSIDPEDDLFLKGAGRMESLEYLLHKGQLLLTHNQKETLLNEKNRIYHTLIDHLTREDLLPGVKEIIGEAKAGGFPIAIASGSRNARLILEKTDTIGLFDHVLDANDVPVAKPDPEIYLRVCALIGLDPSETVVIEDAEKGVQSARRAGCYVLGLGHPEYLKGAHMTAPDLADLRLADILQGVSTDLIA